MTEHILQEPWVALLKRNPSYASSLKTTARRVVFYGPSAWWWLVGPLVKLVLLAIPQLLFLTAMWVVTTLVLLVAGLCGFVTAPAAAPSTAENGDEAQKGCGGGEGA